MRYALIADIHANLTATQSVLSDISKQHVDKIICLGDTLGYGPQPAETLELIYQVTECHLLGNHDAAVCGKLNPIIFCDPARKAVLKHREMLSDKAARWLHSLPLTLKAPSFRCVHGDFTKPGAYRYIISEEDALLSFKANTEQLMFAGHTHLAAIYVMGNSGVPHYLEPTDFILEDDKRYIINPGTVGYPRSGKFESTYCIFDTEERSIIFRHLPFDHVAYNQALRKAGFDEIPWIKLKTAGLTLPEVRERLSFKKPLENKDHLNETLEKIKNSHRLQLKKYRSLLISIAMLSLAASAFLVNKVHKARAEADTSLTLPAGRMQVIQPKGNGLQEKNYLHPLPDNTATGQEIQGWRYILTDSTTQELSTSDHVSGNSLVVRHTTRQSFVLESPLVRIAGTDLNHLRMRGRIRKLKGFSGTVSYQLQSYSESDDGTIQEEKHDIYEVRGRSSEGPDVAAITRKVRMNKSTTHVRFRIIADFSGAVELCRPELFGHDDTIPSNPNTEGNIP